MLLEERELRERFGTEYEDYCRRVPRYLPKLGPRGRDPALTPEPVTGRVRRRTAEAALAAG